MVDAEPAPALPSPTMAETDDGIAVKIPRQLVDRVDALIAYVETDPELAPLFARVGRAAVLRLVLLRGLEAVEARYRKRTR